MLPLSFVQPFCHQSKPGIEHAVCRRSGGDGSLLLESKRMCHVFPIGTAVSRIVRFCRPRHNPFAGKRIPAWKVGLSQAAADVGVTRQATVEEFLSVANRHILWKIKRREMVRKGGFEPPRLTAPPPQDGASASSATSARGEVKQ